MCVSVCGYVFVSVSMSENLCVSVFVCESVCVCVETFTVLVLLIGFLCYLFTVCSLIKLYFCIHFILPICHF